MIAPTTIPVTPGRVVTPVAGPDPTVGELGSIPPLRTMIASEVVRIAQRCARVAALSRRSAVCISVCRTCTRGRALVSFDGAGCYSIYSGESNSYAPSAG